MMQEHRASWFTLVGFCAAAILAAALGFGALLAGVSAVFAGSDSAPIERPAGGQLPAQGDAAPPREAGPIAGEAGAGTFSGIITDSGCGARHSRDSDKTSAECARSCVRRGARYMLVDGEKSYFLEGKKAQLEKVASQRVDVVGVLEGDVIRVRAVIAR